ncbi:uracil-DNA glycosylase family protein [Paraburkholderia xenovorans]|uniref:uracil-DNA glycosylase family protein n=1 Tax=Paraburkholderia xenovorans TaxID=36873 RepID=UPI0038BD07BE
MALHESVLEEFGLSPLWVRRGMAVQQRAGEVAGEVTQASAGPGAARHGESGAAAPGGARSALAAASAIPAQDDPRAASQADSAQVPDERGAPRRVEQTPAQARERFDRDAPGRAGEMSRPMPASGQSDARAPSEQVRTRPSTQAPIAEPSRAEQPTSRQPRVAEPPLSDAQPAQPASHDDDFAWFDDLPSHPPTKAPAESRAETPQLPSLQTLGWDALGERVANCRLCRLCEKRTNTVFGVGDREADWMLIGEAPGENEDRLGEPFVGQAGKLLDNMLRSLTLARDANVYIANVIKCRPPGNRNPEPDEVARCEPYLQRQVSLVKPKLIVALGRFAAQSLLKTESSISSLRGRVHEYEGVPVIVTYHPAYLLRSLPDKAKAWADLCLARDTWLKAGGVQIDAAKK